MTYPPVYIEQFGGYWKLSDEQWIALLVEGAAGHGHMLPEAQQLAGRPKFIRSDRYGDDRSSLYCIDDHRFHQPLDWDETTYADQLAEEMAARADPQA